MNEEQRVLIVTDLYIQRDTSYTNDKDECSANYILQSAQSAIKRKNIYMLYIQQTHCMKKESVRNIDLLPAGIFLYLVYIYIYIRDIYTL